MKYLILSLSYGEIVFKDGRLHIKQIKLEPFCL